MENDKKIYIIIPAFNEERQIGSVIQSLKKQEFHNVLVINDGSHDNTQEVAEKAGAEVLNHIMNRGQGAALRTGIEYLREEKDPDIIVTFDADGQHDVREIEKLITPIIIDEADIVLGSRFINNNSDIPALRKVILKMGIIFTNMISNIHLTDTHNGLRALNKKAAYAIKMTQRGMEHASEIIDEIKKNGLRYKEVPVTIAYSEYSKGKGQKTSNFIKMGIKILIKKIS